MRYKTAAISCFALVGGMFALPAMILGVFLPSLKSGIPDPIPAYERILLEIAVFCVEWKWLLAVPSATLGLAFTGAALAAPRVRK